jgi:hypothetical protein
VRGKKREVSNGGTTVKLEIGVRTGRRRERRERNQVVWGLFLIGLGVVFLLSRLDVIDLHRWTTWWPSLMILFGAARIIAPGQPRHIASGISFILIGIWFYACIEHWYGLRFRNGWPILVVVAGLEMVTSAMLERLWPNWKEDDWKPEEEERHA